MKGNFVRWRLRLGFLLTLPLAAPLFAQEQVEPLSERSAFSFRGFGTVGMVRSSTDESQFVRDLSQSYGATRQWSHKVDSVLGAQLNYQITPDTDAVAQVISAYHGDGTSSPQVHMAFVRTNFAEHWAARAGRLGPEFYMRSDSGHIGYALLTVRPQSDFYASIPYHYMDGGDVQYVTSIDDGVLKTKLYVGETQEVAPLGGRTWPLKGSKVRGGYLDYQRNEWQWRLSYAQIRHANDLPLDDLVSNLQQAGAAAAASRLQLQGTTSRFYSAGVAYDWGPWQAQFMLNRIKHEADIFESSRGGLALLGYRVGAWTPYAGYSWIQSIAKPSGTGLPNVGALATLNAAYAVAMADSHANQHTVTLGVRWDVKPNVALKVQLDSIRGGADSILLTRWDRAAYQGRMNILAIAMDFIF